MKTFEGRCLHYSPPVPLPSLPGVARSADPGVTKDKVILGSFLPLQSGLAAGATQMKEGCDAYFKYINDLGGVNGRKIEWIVENDSYNPQQTAAVVKKLVDRDEVFAIVSTLGTVTNLAVLPFLAQRGIPIINPAGGHMLLNKPTDKNVFGILPLSSEIGELMTDFAVTKLGAKRVAIFFQNDQFGKDQRDGAVEALKKHNLQSVAEASYVPSDVDVSAPVVALKQANPDAVILGIISLSMQRSSLKRRSALGGSQQLLATIRWPIPLFSTLLNTTTRGRRRSARRAASRRHAWARGPMR